MEKYFYGNVSASIHFGVSYCVEGDTKKTTLDYGTASLDIERERIALEEDGYLTRLKITNTSGKRLKLFSAYPIITEDLNICDIPSRNWRIFNDSRQLNDIPATSCLGERDVSFMEASDRLSDEGRQNSGRIDGDMVLMGDGISIISAGNMYVSLEILTGEEQMTDASVSVDHTGNVKAIRLGGEFNCIMDTDDVVYTDWVRITQGGNFVRLLEEYACKKRELSYAKPQKSPCAIFKADDGFLEMSKKISVLTSLKAPFDYIELGGKWYDYIGDWENGEGLNVSYIADVINKSSYKAGIWTAPFLCDRNSELFETKKNWLLRHADGSLCTYEAQGRTYAVLDASCDEFLDYLSMKYKHLSAQGFYMHHIDHSMAFIIQKDVVLTNPKLSMAKAYRNAMRLISVSAGDESYICVTNGFLPSLCGLADSVQISSEIEVLKNNANNANVIPKLINQCSMRAYTRKWWNTVCSEMFDDKFLQKYSRSEKRNLMVCEYIAGSPSVTTNVAKADLLNMLKYTYPHVTTSVYPRSAFEDRAYIDCVDVEVNDSYHTLCIFNHSFSEAELTFRLNSKLCGGYANHASKYNISAYFNRCIKRNCKYDDVINLGTIPPNSCEIVKIAKNDKVQVIMSDMHFSMGGELKIDAHRDFVTVSGKNPFNCKGCYTLALPETMQCIDGKGEFTFTVNGEGEFSYTRQIKTF